MSADAVTDVVIAAVEKRIYSLIVINYATRTWWVTQDR
jgi:bisphosphoglycerate-independent phosphoglycerate mutase (AlkP superfamily)